jgi:K+:H+ antiporter
MRRLALIYTLILGFILAGIVVVLHHGQTLARPAGTPPSAASASTHATSGNVVESAFAEVQRDFNDPLGKLLLQLFVVIAASRLVGKLFTRVGQPAVVGEMAAGILLGPSLLGLVAPEAFSLIFPPASMGTLKLLSQIGVCLFMFAVGMDLDVAHVRQKAHVATVVSHASIVIPYFLGVCLAYFLYTDLAAAGAGFTGFALFMGISMSITAFPVLARILQDRRLSKTFLGITAITCAAVDDVTAWSILAFVVAIIRATSLAAAGINLLLVLLFIAAMVWIVRPALPRLIGSKRLEEEEPSKGVLALIICVVVAAALSTEMIGIHALFGSFLAGAIMPHAGSFRHKLAIRIENFSSVLLLPLFFTFTGLRTQIGLLNNSTDWLICGLIILVATIGKLGGSAVTARLAGIQWSEALKLGALMNTRGLMELIALNIGYDLGILSPRVFTMLVIMALVTTFLTGPLLDLFSRKTVTVDDGSLASSSPRA